MDKFEQMIHDVMDMSENDRNKAIEGYKDSCICQICATYNECASDANEKLFCVNGKVRIVLPNQGDVNVLHVH